MNAISETRNFFGLSQEELASYMFVSESLLKHAETGTRTLPASAFVKLAVLQKIVYQPPAIATAPPFSQPALQNETGLLQQELEKQQHKASILRRQPEAMQTKFREANNRLQLVAYIKSMPGMAADKGIVLWMDVIAFESGLAVAENGSTAQALLQ